MICVLCLFVKFIVTKHSGVFIFPFFPLNSLRYLSYYNSNEKTLYREHCLPVCVQAQYLLLKRFFFKYPLFLQQLFARLHTEETVLGNNNSAASMVLSLQGPLHFT